MYRGVFLLGILACGFLTEAVSEQADTAAVRKGVTISGMGSIEFGQLINYQFRGNDFKRAWLSQAKVRLSAQKMVTSWLEVSLGVEGAAWYETYDKFSNNPFVVPEKFYTFTIHESKAVFSWGDILTVETGVFPYKYSPEVRNLGEFLFRSGTYPGFLIGEFDFPLARLTGLRVNNRLFGKLDQDLLITTETDFKPFHDVSLTYIADVAPHPSVHIGAGISFAHLFSVDEEETTPGTDGAWFIEDPDTLRDSFGSDSVILGDTVDLTFKGIKVMARFTFDVKRFFDCSFFGPEDLKIYAEATILGVKDYQLYYDTLQQRIPIMAGFNIPGHPLVAFGSLMAAGLLTLPGLPHNSVHLPLSTIVPMELGLAAGGATLFLLKHFLGWDTNLDVFAFEAQWYDSPYPNNYSNAVSVQPQPRPIPDLPSGSYTNEDYTKDSWKWSVYVRKTIAESFCVTAQVARDHFRTKSDNPWNVERGESLTKDEHWYWMLKLGYRF